MTEPAPLDSIGPVGQTVAGNLARLRRQRGLSYDALAMRTADLGRTIHATALKRVEVGQRRVDVDDLTVLALALDVSQADLLTPYRRNSS